MEFPKSQKAPNKIKNREQLTKVIEDLKKRRQTHDIRIKKLLSCNYSTEDISNSSIPQGQFSEVLRRLEDEDLHHIQESVEGLSSHVNLLATVSLKTEYHLSQKPLYKQAGHLYNSLVKAFPGKYFNFNFTDHQLTVTQNWINHIVNYLNEWDLGQGLFTESRQANKQLDYYGTRFNLGKYEQVQLSVQQLQKQQHELIYVQKNQKNIVNISCLLLKRLVNLTHNPQIHIVLQRLFFFPIHTYQIRNSLELIDFVETLAQLEQSFSFREQEKTIKVYFQQTQATSVHYNVITPKSKNLKALSPLLHRYCKAVIVNEAELPAKQLPLSCLKNHFVVITLIVRTQGQYFISVGSETNNQQFRVCILSREKRFIKSDTIKSGEFMYCCLNAEEYEVYISPIMIEVQVKGVQQSFELVQQNQQVFYIWVQGQQVLGKNGDLSMQIRLKQEYNLFTLRIAQSYIESQNKREQQQLELKKGCLIVKRQILRVMGLVLDTFMTTINSKITVKYEKSVLCDKNFQRRQILVTDTQSVVLYSPVEIESAQYINNNDRIQIEVSVFTFYI